MIIRSWVTEHEIESNIHLIACAQTREAAIIDAGSSPDELGEEIDDLGLRVTKILLTHSHWDHIGALPEIMAAHAAPVIASTEVAPRTEIVKEGDEVTVGKLRGRVLKTSGHTPDSITYVFEDRVAFTGDALFAGSIGGTSNDKLKAQEISHIRSKILTLADDCEIRCGHGPASTVGIEKAANPFFQ
jgi:glyoxylase-like metal-dependent hydrolase (beta-lactamase superfamily II)